jgi:hypothetical protein
VERMHRPAAKPGLPCTTGAWKTCFGVVETWSARGRDVVGAWPGRGRRMAGTWPQTHLKGCSIERLRRASYPQGLAGTLCPSCPADSRTRLECLGL